MYYKPQSMNIDKHPDMPDGYPWLTSNISLGAGSIYIDDADYQTLLDSFDLSAFNTAMQYVNNLHQQSSQREYGIHLIPILIDMMGERNLTLAQNGSTINMIAIASDNASVKLLIETGALKTARSVCSQLKQKYPSHSDIYDKVIELISTFLTEQGYE